MADTNNLNARGKNAIEDGKQLVKLLHDIETRCLSHAVGLPQHETAEENWEGVLFSIAGRLFATPMIDISEILNYPTAMTRVPGTRQWITGIANIRGNLLPIIDLQAFVTNKQTMRGRRSRVLVINHEGLYSGLLVDPFVGIRRFYVSEKIPIEKNKLPETINQYKAYINEVYVHNGETWPIFNIHVLIASAEFGSAAA